VCFCGRTFTSANGYRMHQHENESTKNGKCLEKRSAREVFTAEEDLKDYVEEESSNVENASMGEQWDPQLEHMIYGAFDFEMSLPQI
jgi:hypothetical protein